MPFRRLPSLACMLPMVGEECCTVAELRRIELLHRAGNDPMDADSVFRELRTVGNLLSQRMLEDVLRLRVQSLLIEELSARQGMESGREVSIAQIGHPPKDWLGEPRADHRRRLEYLFFPLG